MKAVVNVIQIYKPHIIFLLCLLGLFVSVFLAYEYSQPKAITCPWGGGCDTVRNSPYSHILGISVPILGIIYYLGLSVATLISIELHNLKLLKFHQLMVVSGVLASVYFTFLEAFVINAYCFWCLTSAIITVVIFTLEFGSKRAHHED
jgi:uncharacterized membrane protein